AAGSEQRGGRRLRLRPEAPLAPHRADRSGAYDPDRDQRTGRVPPLRPRRLQTPPVDGRGAPRVEATRETEGRRPDLPIYFLKRLSKARRMSAGRAESGEASRSTVTRSENRLQSVRAGLSATRPGMGSVHSQGRVGSKGAALRR